MRLITQKALHGMSAQRTVSIQEAVHMVHNQDLVISLEKFTYLSLRQGAMLHNEKETKDKKDMLRGIAIAQKSGTSSAWMSISIRSFAAKS